MNESLIVIADYHLTLAHALLLLIGMSFLMFCIFFFSSRNQKQIAYENEEKMSHLAEMQAQMTGRMQTFAEVFGSRQGDVMRLLNERLDGVGQRLGESMDKQTRSTLENLAALQERLAVIDTAQNSLSSLANEMVTLKDVFANKQARGAFGQARMEAILQDGLPSKSYSLQPTLSNGKRPDAVIHMPNDRRSLVLDAKFPLESISAWRSAGNEFEKKQAIARVKSDIGKHINDIEEKYFIAGETQDIALLFVPSEGVYADLHEHFDEILQRAFKSRVIIVSPSLMMLAIQVMQSLLKDEAMREQAHLIRQEVGMLTDDLRRISERILNLNKHFGQANEDISQIMISHDRLMKRSNRLNSLDFDEKSQGGNLKGNANELPLKQDPIIARLLRVGEK